MNYKYLGLAVVIVSAAIVVFTLINIGITILAYAASFALCAFILYKLFFRKPTPKK